MYSIETLRYSVQSNIRKICGTLLRATHATNHGREFRSLTKNDGVRCEELREPVTGTTPHRRHFVCVTASTPNCHHFLSWSQTAPGRCHFACSGIVCVTRLGSSHTIKHKHIKNNIDYKLLEKIKPYKASRGPHKKWGNCRIVGQVAADTLVKHLLVDLRDEDTIAEVNAGPGILSQSLIKHTPNRLLLFDHDDEQRAHLKEIFGDRVTVCDHSFATMNPSSYLNNLESKSKKLKEFLELLPVQIYKEQCNFRVLAVVSHYTLMSKILYAIVFNSTLFSKAYPTFYLYITDELYKRYFSTFPFAYSSQFKSSLKYEFFFKTTKLDVQPMTEFFPLPKAKRSPATDDDDSSIYHLVKMEPSWSILNKVIVTIFFYPLFRGKIKLGKAVQFEKLLHFDIYSLGRGTNNLFL